MSNKKENPVCLRCSGPMEPGVMTEVSLQKFQNYSPRHLWVKGEGTPMKGLLATNEDVQLVSGVEKYYVEAYRCSLCGYLELYTSNQA